MIATSNDLYIPCFWEQKSWPTRGVFLMALMVNSKAVNSFHTFAILCRIGLISNFNKIALEVQCLKFKHVCPEFHTFLNISFKHVWSSPFFCPSKAGKKLFQTVMEQSLDGVVARGESLDRLMEKSKELCLELDRLDKEKNEKNRKRFTLGGVSITVGHIGSKWCWTT